LTLALLALALLTALVPGAARAQLAPPDSVPPAVLVEPAPAASPDSAVVEGAGVDSTGVVPAVVDTAAVDTAAVAPPPPPPHATIRVETQPSGLQVDIDGAPVGRTPLGPLAVPPGTHRVRATPADPRRFGVPVGDTVVTLAVGSEVTVRIDMRPPVVLRTNPEPALVTLTRRPAAADSLLGSTPLSIRPSVIETSFLRFTRESFADTVVAGAAFLASDPLLVPLRQISALRSPSASKGRTPILRKRWFQWSLIGIGAVLTGAAAVWHNEADRAYEEYLDSSNVEEIPGLYDRTIDYDRRATASFIVGQASMITGALLLLTGQSH
jgi:PEGA domain-containing protein